MDLNKAAKEIHDLSRANGFWEGERNPFEVLALIHSEVSEALEEIRDGNWKPAIQWTASRRTAGPSLEFRDGEVWTVGDFPRQVTDAELIGWGYDPKPVGLPSELADIVIRVLDACAAWNIDIEQAIALKHNYNRTRPFKHGRKH